MVPVFDSSTKMYATVGSLTASRALPLPTGDTGGKLVVGRRNPGHRTARSFVPSRPDRSHDPHPHRRPHHRARRASVRRCTSWHKGWREVGSARMPEWDVWMPGRARRDSRMAQLVRADSGRRTLSGRLRRARHCTIPVPSSSGVNPVAGTSADTRCGDARVGSPCPSTMLGLPARGGKALHGRGPNGVHRRLRRAARRPTLGDM